MTEGKAKEIRFALRMGVAKGKLLTNWAPTPITWRGKEYRTAEHAYQSAQFMEHDPEWGERVRRGSTVWVARKLARDRRHLIPMEWHSRKLNIMREIVEAKFLQYPRIKALLLGPLRDYYLRNGDDKDHFWGSGRDGRGHNWLGKIWMEIRETAIQALEGRAEAEAEAETEAETEPE